MAKVVLENGGKIIGNWPRENYSFAESKALKNKDYFYGLPLDQDNEDELTLRRLEKWVEQLKSEISEI